MPTKKKKYNARFPPARIKKIMQTDDDVGKVAAAVPVIISRALELFIESLIQKTSGMTQTRNAKTLSTQHIKQTIESERQFDFLKDLVANVPDVQNDEDNDSNSTGCNSEPPLGGPRRPGRPRKQPKEGNNPSRRKERKPSSDGSTIEADSDMDEEDEDESTSTPSLSGQNEFTDKEKGRLIPPVSQPPSDIPPPIASPHPVQPTVAPPVFPSSAYSGMVFPQAAATPEEDDDYDS